jgi:exonuclease SbcC
MLVHRLRLVNFRQHEDTDLRFGPGLTGVIGPNGAGKTTLLEALAWALYGTKAARGTADSIRRRNAPARARVEVTLEFSLGAHRYRVTRSLHGAELYQDTDPAPIANSSAAVTERLGRILGMTRDEFFNTYFTGQKELAVMSALGPADRERFLSRVLGYERLAAAQKRLSADRSVLRARLQALESTLVSPAELADEERAAAAQLDGARAATGAAARAEAEAVAAVAVIEPEWQAMTALQERVRSLESDLKVAEQQVTASREAFAALDRDLTEALTAQARMAELAPRLAGVPDLVAELARLEVLAGQLARRREAVGQAAELRRRVAAIDARLATLPLGDAVAAAREGLEAVRRDLAEAESAAEQQRTDWVRDQQEVDTKLKQLRDQYRETREQHEALIAAGPDGSCPTCGRPLGGELEGVLAELSRQMDDLNFNGNYFRQRFDQLKQEPAAVAEARAGSERLRQELNRRTAESGRLEMQAQTREALTAERRAHEERLAALAQEIAEVAEGYDEARHQEVKAALEALDPDRRLAGRLEAIAERAPRLAEQAATSEVELTRREQVVSGLREQLAAAGWSAEASEALRERRGLAVRRRQETEVAAVRASAAVAAAEAAAAAVARRREERDRRAAEARGVEQELLLNQELDRAFTDLRSDLNDTLRPDLSDLGSHFLRELTAGRYSEFELDEDYLPGIIEDGEALRVLSGGEEDVVSLALRLAISQMIAERAGQPLSLLVLDEIFGSLDEDRRTSVIDLLRHLADRFPQVILITHIESVRDGFDRVLRLRYDVERGVARAVDEPDGGQSAAA